MKRALIVWGGWDGHEPEQVSELFGSLLRGEGFEVKVENSLDAFVAEDLSSYDLLVPVWTMGEISPAQVKAVAAAVDSGVGIAGCHGGMCDAFRNEPLWQFITGGQWVAHPGDDGVEYQVRLVDPSHPLTAGLESFS